MVYRPRFSKILIHDTRGDEIAAYLSARRPDLVCRIRTAETRSPADRVWADALIGFTEPADLEGSSIRWVHSTCGPGWMACCGVIGGRLASR